MEARKNARGCLNASRDAQCGWAGGRPQEQPCCFGNSREQSCCPSVVFVEPPGSAPRSLLCACQYSLLAGSAVPGRSVNTISVCPGAPIHLFFPSYCCSVSVSLGRSETYFPKVLPSSALNSSSSQPSSFQLFPRAFRDHPPASLARCSDKITKTPGQCINFSCSIFAPTSQVWSQKPRDAVFFWCVPELVGWRRLWSLNPSLESHFFLSSLLPSHIFLPRAEKIFSSAPQHFPFSPSPYLFLFSQPSPASSFLPSSPFHIAISPAQRHQPRFARSALYRPASTTSQLYFTLQRIFRSPLADCDFHHRSQLFLLAHSRCRLEILGLAATSHFPSPSHLPADYVPDINIFQGRQN